MKIRHLIVLAAGLLFATGGPMLAQVPTPEGRLSQMSPSPESQRRLDKVSAVVARGPIQYAILDTPMPTGLRAVVRLNQRLAPKRYAVVAAESLTDEVVARVSMAAASYAIRNPSDLSPVEIRIYAGDRMEIASEQLGKSERTLEVTGHSDPQDRNTKRLLNARGTAKSLTIPDFGSARLVELVAENQE